MLTLISTSRWWKKRNLSARSIQFAISKVRFKSLSDIEGLSSYRCFLVNAPIQKSIRWNSCRRKVRKTLQTLAFYLVSTKTTIILCHPSLCPASLLEKWKRKPFDFALNFPAIFITEVKEPHPRVFSPSTILS